MKDYCLEIVGKAITDTGTNTYNTNSLVPATCVVVQVLLPAEGLIASGFGT